jgi:Fe-S cluster assembly iron-binding protein IscA
MNHFVPLSAAALVALTSSWAYADNAVIIDSIERSTDARAGQASDSDASSDPSIENWVRSASASFTSSLCFASAKSDHDSLVNTERFSVTLDAIAQGKLMKAEASSSLVIEFTLEREDYSLPDSTWGYSGSSPLETVLGSAPAFELDITGRAWCPAMRGNAELVSNSVSPGIGYSLWCDGVLVAEKRLVSSLSGGRLVLDSVLLLAPGEYALEIDCGVATKLGGFRRPNFGFVMVDFEASLTPVAPGAGLESLWSSHRFGQVNAGYGPNTWSENPIVGETWKYAGLSYLGGLAKHGNVIKIEDGACHGFIFGRSAQKATSTSPSTMCSGGETVVIKIPSTMIVNVATLTYFQRDNASDTANWANGNVRVRKLSGGNEYDDTVRSTDVSDGFTANDTSLVLTPGLYAFYATISTHTPAVDGTEAGIEMGFWFAYSFEEL